VGGTWRMLTPPGKFVAFCGATFRVTPTSERTDVPYRLQGPQGLQLDLIRCSDGRLFATNAATGRMTDTPWFADTRGFLEVLA
jgi:hypothetical protein